MSDSNGLPNGWTEMPIEKFLEPLADGRLLHHGWSPQCETQPSISENEWGVLKTTSIQDGSFHPEHNKRLPQSLEPRSHLEVKPGDILITCAGPRNRCGVPCLVRQTRPRLILSGKMYRFRVRKELMEPAYMEGFLRTSKAQKAIDAMKTGISDSGLNLTHGRFLKLVVPQAPLDDQRTIIAKLDELFSDLDAGVAALESANAKLRRYRSAVLKATIEGKLTEEWRAKNPKVESASQLLERILVERRTKWEADQLAKFAAAGKQPPKNWRNKYVIPKPPDIASLPELPKGWCWATIDHLLREPLRNGHSARATQNGTGIRTLTLTAVTEDDFSEANTKLTSADPVSVADLWLEPGDIFIERSNTAELVGTARMFRGASRFAIFPDLLIRIRISQLACADYVALALQSHYARRYFQKRAKGLAGNMPKIDQETVLIFPVPFPPLVEQLQLVSRADALIAVTKAGAYSLALAERRAILLRQAILNTAFSARLFTTEDRTKQPTSRAGKQ